MKIPASRALLALPVGLILVIGCLLPLMLLLVFSFFTVDMDAFVMVPAFSGEAWGQIFTKPVFVFLIGKAVIFGLATAGLPLWQVIRWRSPSLL